MNKSKIFMIISICVLCISIVGGTVAYYVQTLYEDRVGIAIRGLDYYINYTKGQTISGTLEPSYDYNTDYNSTIELWKDSETPYQLFGSIYLDVNTISSTMTSLSALKYVLINNDEILKEGTITTSAGGNILLKENIPLKTTEDLYTVYIWLDESKVNSTLSEETVSLSVRCEVTMKPIDTNFLVPVNGIEMITKLYTDNVDATATPVTFADGTGANYYAESVGLMNDGLDSAGNMTNDVYTGNIRYYGADPNNYIYFNCKTYPETNCETWRIIGIVDGKIKLVGASIGTYSWDFTSTGEYDNNWSDATLMTLLNNAYYERETITYYNNSTIGETVNFATNGITDATRDNNLISSSIWYTNGASSAAVYANSMYATERTGTSTWPGNIALPYVSDYGYAADLNVCTSKINVYNNCRTYNWMYTGINRWFLTHNSSATTGVWRPYSSGRIGNRVVNYTGVVLPTVYLDTNVKIIGGDGSVLTPYKISI